MIRPVTIAGLQSDRALCQADKDCIAALDGGAAISEAYCKGIGGDPITCMTQGWLAYVDGGPEVGMPDYVAVKLVDLSLTPGLQAVLRKRLGIRTPASTNTSTIFAVEVKQPAPLAAPSKRPYVIGAVIFAAAVIGGALLWR